jgi:acyl dehydratase
MPAISSIADVHVGEEVPPLLKDVEAANLVRYAGAADDYVYLHWDKVRVLEEGFPDVIVHGWLTFAYMCQSVSDWIPRELADIESYAVRYRQPTYPGRLTCSGEVSAVRAEEGATRIELDLWAKNSEGQVTATAKMTLVAE